MWKDKGLQLVMLPTKEETSLIIDDNSGLLHKLDNPKEAAWGFQYLYLLSDEEIKAGDWFIGKDLDGCNYVLKCDSIKDAYCYTDNKAKGGYGIVKKIIASNNPSLNLPQFPSSFLEEYVKRYNSKKSLGIEVGYEEYGEELGCDPAYYGLPSHRVKQVNNTISIRFKEEKMYSQAQMEMRLLEGIGHAISYPETFVTGICLDSTKTKNWIKENLK